MRRERGDWDLGMRWLWSLGREESVCFIRFLRERNSRHYRK